MIVAVSIRGEQMSGQPAFFDDLRVGFSFSDVVGGGSVPTGGPIPTVSEWGLILMALLMLTAGTILLRRPAGSVLRLKANGPPASTRQD